MLPQKCAIYVISLLVTFQLIQWPGYVLDSWRVVVQFPAEQVVFFYFPKRPRLIWGPPGLILNGYWTFFFQGQSGRALKLTNRPTGTDINNRGAVCMYILPWVFMAHWINWQEPTQVQKQLPSPGRLFNYTVTILNSAGLQLWRLFLWIPSWFYPHRFPGFPKSRRSLRHEHNSSYVWWSVVILCKWFAYSLVSVRL